MRRPSRRSTAGSRSRSSATTSASRTSVTSRSLRGSRRTPGSRSRSSRTSASTDSYAQLARLFSSKSSSVDVMMLDVVWPGAFAPFLVNLRPALSKEAKLHSQGIIRGATFAREARCNAVLRRLRDPLLPNGPAEEVHGYSKPPTTWAQLGAMAKKIQEGESARRTPTSPASSSRGTRTRGSPATRSSGWRRWRRPLHRRREGDDRQPARLLPS